MTAAAVVGRVPPPHSATQIRTETLVPCIHCIARKAPRPHLFDLQECEQAAAHGVGYLTCSGQVRYWRALGHSRAQMWFQFPVALQSLCPDILVSSELPVVKWDALHNMERVGEGTFAYVYRALLNQEEGALPISNKNWAAYSHLSQVAVKRLIDETDFRELRKEAASLLSLKVSAALKRCCHHSEASAAPQCGDASRSLLPSRSTGD